MEEKVLLGDFIYQLHKKRSFYGESKLWAKPFACFSASTDETIAQKAPKFIEDLKSKKLLREDIDDLICVLGDWETVAEGIFLQPKQFILNRLKIRIKIFE